MSKPRQQTEEFTIAQLGGIHNALERWQQIVEHATKAIEHANAESLYTFGSPSLRAGSERMQAFFSELENSATLLNLGTPLTATSKKRSRARLKNKK